MNRKAAGLLGLSLFLSWAPKGQAQNSRILSQPIFNIGPAKALGWDKALENLSGWLKTDEASALATRGLLPFTLKPQDFSKSDHLAAILPLVMASPNLQLRQDMMKLNSKDILPNQRRELALQILADIEAGRDAAAGQVADAIKPIVNEMLQDGSGQDRHGLESRLALLSKESKALSILADFYGERLGDKSRQCDTKLQELGTAWLKTWNVDIDKLGYSPDPDELEKLRQASSALVKAGVNHEIFPATVQDTPFLALSLSSNGKTRLNQIAQGLTKMNDIRLWYAPLLLSKTGAGGAYLHGEKILLIPPSAITTEDIINDLSGHEIRHAKTRSKLEKRESWPYYIQAGVENGSLPLFDSLNRFGGTLTENIKKLYSRGFSIDELNAYSYSQRFSLIHLKSALRKNDSKSVERYQARLIWYADRLRMLAESSYVMLKEARNAPPQYASGPSNTTDAFVRLQNPSAQTYYQLRVPLVKSKGTDDPRNAQFLIKELKLALKMTLIHLRESRQAQELFQKFVSEPSVQQRLEILQKYKSPFKITNLIRRFLRPGQITSA